MEINMVHTISVTKPWNQVNSKLSTDTLKNILKFSKTSKALVGKVLKLLG